MSAPRRMLAWFRGDQERLVWHAFIVFFFSQIGAWANLLYHMVMGRWLSAEEYGALVSLSGVVLIFSTPMAALQNTLAHLAARLREAGRAGGVRGLVVRGFARSAWVVVPLGLATVAAASPLAAFFRLQDVRAVRLLGTLCGLTLWMAIAPGALQGLQAFVWMSTATNVCGVARLVLGVAFVALGGRVAFYALSGLAVGEVLSIAVGVWGLRWVLRGTVRERSQLTGGERYFAQALLALALYGFLMNADVVMVKHFFPPAEAGLFARAATIARTVVFVSQPVAVALFPKVVSLGDFRVGHRATLFRALALVALVVGISVLICVAAPALPLRILYGPGALTPEQKRLLPWVALAMSPLGLSYLLLNFEMAQHRFMMLAPLTVCAAAYVAGVWLWHATLNQVIAVMAAVTVTLAVALVACLPWKDVDAGCPRG